MGREDPWGQERSRRNFAAYLRDRRGVRDSAGRVARRDSAAFPALHCPLVSGAETAPLGGRDSPSWADQKNLHSFPGHKPCQSCPRASRKPWGRAQSLLPLLQYSPPQRGHRARVPEPGLPCGSRPFLTSAPQAPLTSPQRGPEMWGLQTGLDYRLGRYGERLVYAETHLGLGTVIF